MKTTYHRHFAILARLGLVLLLGAATAPAIEIDIPEQYQEDVERLRAEEKKELQEELEQIESGEGADAVGEAAAGDEGMQFTGQGPSEDTAPDAGGGETPTAGSGNFLLESVEEAEGAAETYEEDLPENQGLISGQVVDQESGAPVPGVAILLEGTDTGTITDAEGRYSLGPAPAGQYTLSFVKSGYIEANVTEFEVKADQVSVFPFTLPPRPAEMSDEVYELQDFSVTAQEANDMMMKLDMRMDSDSIMDVLSSEDFSKFAASDVGDAIKRVAGVTVEGGEFAVIRGLDERYSSTVLNGAPVPSPDPDRQSVPLNLFPSDVVKNLTVTKTFSPELPGNSAGGSINILTNVYPEEFQINVSAKLGANSNAEDRFLTDGDRPRVVPNFSDAQNISNLDPLADARGIRVTPSEGEADTETDFSIDGGGTFEVFDRAVRFLGSASTEEDFSTRVGEEDNRLQIRGQTNPNSLDYSSGAFDLTQSARTERTTLLGSFEVDLDEEGDHKINFTYFDTEDEEESASLRENGFYPGKVTQDDFDDETELGNALFNFFASDFNSSQSPLDDLKDTRLITSSIIDTERELTVRQIGGSHDFSEVVEDLKLGWQISRSSSKQVDFDAFTARGLVMPEGALPGGFLPDIPVPEGSFFVGQSTDSRALQPTRSWRRIQEDQDFQRIDGTYRRQLFEGINFELGSGYSDESTERSTEQLFFNIQLEQFADTTPSDTFEGAMQASLKAISQGNAPGAVATGERDIDAFYAKGKLEVGDKFDAIGGFRFEKVAMTTGTNVGGDQFFNSDILRDTDSNPTNTSTPSQAILNTQILGINNSKPLNPDFVGEINEDLMLPSLSFVYRPIEGVRATLAYSETNVRPSFKEFTFLTVRDPITLDFESGNPALTTSDVQSWDARLEYAWNGGDLVAISVFHKTIENPIEKTNLSGEEVTDIFFNNPNDAVVQGIEFEARKKLGFFGPDFLEYFSIGGNLALIDANVDVPETFLQLFNGGFEFDSNADGTVDSLIGGGFREISEERGLFQQPEWLVNGDISFDQPDWGSKATLSVFGQSRVLETAAGFVDATGTGTVSDLASFNEYQMPYLEVNFTFSQQIRDNMKFGFTVKNLTDSERGIEYEDGVASPDKRSFRVGRDYTVFFTLIY